MTSILLLSLMTAAQTQPDLPKSESYTNPVWSRDFPDPFLTRVGDDFYVYGTQNSPHGFQIMKSRDLVHWEKLEAVGKPDWSSANLWAPEAYLWKGQWHFFFSALDPQTRKRDLAVSVGPGPTGPFTFVSRLVRGVEVNTGSDDNGAIDPTLYVENGTPYLLYIHEAPPRSVCMVQLSPDLSRTVGEARPLLGVDRRIEQGILDAPTLVKKDGVYWLFYSSGWFQSNLKDAAYRVWAARSSRLFGPYVKPEKPVLESVEGKVYSPGHQSVLELPSGEWVIAYHGWSAEGEPRYGANPHGRTLRIDRLTWTDQGPVSNGPTTTPQPMPSIRARKAQSQEG